MRECTSNLLGHITEELAREFCIGVNGAYGDLWHSWQRPETEYSSQLTSREFTVRRDNRNEAHGLLLWILSHCDYVAVRLQIYFLRRVLRALRNLWEQSDKWVIWGVMRRVWGSSLRSLRIPIYTFLCWSEGDEIRKKDCRVHLHIPLLFTARECILLYKNHRFPHLIESGRQEKQPHEQNEKNYR